jgi:hypothetical protein
VEEFVVDLAALVVDEEVAGDEHVVEHLSAAVVEQGVAGWRGNGLLDYWYQ